MFCNGVECISGMLVFQDVVQLPEHQAQKDFHGLALHIPGAPAIGAHTAEVLRQVKGSRVGHGGWVGGDAWFGSVMTAVETKKRFNVESTFIIKNNHSYYPMQALQAVLKARFGDRPAGHWVVFKQK
jgi:hypothetical protein